MGFQQGFRINTNTASLDTYRSYSAAQSGLETNIEPNACHPACGLTKRPMTRPAYRSATV